MKKESFIIKASNDMDLYCLQWQPDGPPIGAVQIVHGMAEHVDRFHEFARFLTDQGFTVIGHDHPGHGKSRNDRLGIVPSEDAFHTLVDETHRVYFTIKQKYPELPVFIFGHSMGSFITQRMMQLQPVQPDGIIYSGSNGKPPLLLHFGIFLSKILSRTMGPDKKSPLIDFLTFGKYNKAFKPNRTDFDWLTRDEEIVDQYVKDPDCGFIYPVGFYRDLFLGLRTLHRHEPFSGYSKSVPMLLVSGDQDPVSDMGKGVQQLKSLLEKSGAESVDINIYPGGRHEMVHEINREEVMDDILSWIQNHLKR
ncbi:alpha/beta hydrolase [Rhodohalobacter sp.]|uniref:alpha/beta hydrolase n=1 Tax=Rhodohalobacter sp. TaxID=1974210 RepID=UPI002ACE47B9|nr:alpha/beta hydrolase [Rhodohalobacter sp.]MDZ7758306.1 alpha/beta hydrolase [Rhodohalobacter sp.]